jgi:hypothetical protein
MAKTSKRSNLAARKGRKKSAPAERPRGPEARPETPGATEPVILGPVETKIFPRNLTARAAHLPIGNPVVTRPEDAVANCYPGLELDVRNLDRRFFPGLVFNFVEPGGDPKPSMHYGARLAYVDVEEDPDLQLNFEQNLDRVCTTLKMEPRAARDLANKLLGKLADLGSRAGDWYLDSIKQGDETIKTPKELTGLTVWRLVRGLEPGPVSIVLRRRDEGHGHEHIELKGWRRLFTDPTTGVISGAYQPGELMQGLCSPWQHDFRDCYCHYWASNRPDLVRGDVYPGEPILPGGEAQDPELNIRLDWMRADRDRELAVSAFRIIEKNRPYQFDHFQINHDWQSLNIVLEGREIDSVRFAEADDTANPFASPDELTATLRDVLAPLELTLVFEYLYARFSLRDPDETKDDQLKGALTLAREYLLLIAVSEMQHLRWDNEILWRLYWDGIVTSYTPVVRLAEMVPSGIVDPLRTGDGSAPDPTQISAYVKSKYAVKFHPVGIAAPTRQGLAEAEQRDPSFDPRSWRMRSLRVLDRNVQQEFINIERRRSYVDRTYARVAATLEQAGQYPDSLPGFAHRILSDGMQHESRFLAIKAALAPFDEEEYLRSDMEPGSTPDTGRVLRLRDEAVKALREAYAAAARHDVAQTGKDIAAARVMMNEMLELAEQSAKNNTGILFFDNFPPG